VRVADQVPTECEPPGATFPFTPRHGGRQR
jgi:hypothetical protein